MVEEVQNVAEEIQQEEVVQPEVVESHPPEESSYQEEVTDKDLNFNRLRDSKEQLERENRELRQAMERSAQEKNPSKQNDDLGLEDDDLVEGKVVKKLYTELNNLKKSYEQERLASIPDKLKAKFSDFEQVVTPENINKLKTDEPELFAAVTSGTDLFSKSVSAYKTIKAMGIGGGDKYVAQKEQAQSNHGRPVSAQAIRGQGALSETNIFAKGLTPELKKQLQEEMAQAAKAH